MAHAVPFGIGTDGDAGSPSGVLLRTIVIGLTAFLTVVDLFATQAILPSLARAYNVTPAAMGFAVNSSTMGMAVAGLVVSLFSQRIDRRLGILVSLVTPLDPDRAARGCAGFDHIHGSARSCRAFAWRPPLRSRLLIWERSAAQPTLVVPSPPTSPAMSRAISSAGWSRPHSRTTWALPRISTSLRR